MANRTMTRRVLLFMSVVSLSSVLGQVSYSIPEEMAKGSLVGNIAQDLGLDVKRLKSGKARIFTGEDTEYIELNKERGVLIIKERIDRESLCGQTTPCALDFQIILENPMQFYSITVEITDINDNSPGFKNKEMKFDISETAQIGSKYVLEKAVDDDVGINGLQGYSLSSSDEFTLSPYRIGSSRHVEMVLKKHLDREKEDRLSLVLTALDGGDPQLSGTILILITVLDANDNAPVCTQTEYKTNVKEDSLKGAVLTTVSASDADEGPHGRIHYSISNAPRGALELFDIDEENGIFTLVGKLDYEKFRHYEIDVRASDEGGNSDVCKVIIQVLDTNDNPPAINIMSTSSSISEDVKPGTVLTMMNVQDPDSDENGKVHCVLDTNVHFTITSTSNNFFTLVTEGELDREVASQYNITVTCSDEGVPSLSSSVTLTLQISDVNDNAPVFERSSYEAYIVENNTPGLSIFTVKARDADWNQNARVSYILEDSSVNGVPVSSYVSVSADSGVIHAVRSFDYEQIKDFQFRVKAQDGGSPPLSSNVTVKMMIHDQNDNPPQVLYPVQTGGSLVDEMVPRSADVGYLVTKVVAVDVDSGQNAWLSYKLQKATDRALFEVGLQNGEIRTIRQVTDKDAVKQRLTVIVEDNGQPSRSATVIVNVAVADSFPEVLSEFTDFTHDKEYNDNLTFYLVLALAVVSFLFITCLVVIISVKIYRWRQSRILYHSNLPVIPYYPPRYSDTLGTGTLPHVYNYEVCRTTDSRKSDCKFGRAGSQNVLIMDPSSTGTMQRIQSEKSILDEPDSPLEISDVNDNAPVFERSSYEAYIVENNTPGLSIFTVKARDADWNQNARVSYILEDSSVNGVPVSSYVSVSADSGVIHAVRSFDYEQIKDFQFRVRAQDGGSPPLSSDVTVKILIQDQNDNPPQVLYPVQTGGSLVDEMVPRSADVGYLVTKVVAVDVDSGQNAWLSYKLQKATDRALFEVGLQNGEIRTIRQVTDKDAVKQRLTVIVEDNGQPSRSATVIVNVAVADSFPEVLSEFTDFTHDKEYNDNLTFYLVLALAVVSFLFITCLVVIISVKIYRWRQSRILYHSNLPVIPYYPPRYSDTLGTGTLPHVYNYEVCRTTDSRKSDCKFGRAGSQNVLIMDPSSTGTMQRIQSEKSILDEPDSPLEDRNDNPPQVLYPVQTGGSLVDEMVPRSADVGYLVTKVVAVDVDSGQNAWLSYKLQKATDRALFEVGLQNGEIRTIRQVTDKDVVKQRLTVIVEDNGQPSRSATVIVNVAVADSFPEVLSEFTDFTHDKEYNDNLTFYLVLALAVVSFLFITCLVVIISVKIYRWRQSRILYHSNLPVIPYYPPRYSDTLGTGTLPHVYNYEVCRTTDSRKSDCKFGRAGSQNVLIMDPSSTGTMQRIQSEKSILDEPDSPLEISDVNDNAPVFERSSYEAYIVENNTPGLSIFTVKARDADWNQNARVSYILEDSSVNGVPVSSYVSVSADSGVIHAVRSFDYEQIKDFQFRVKAQDGGSPPLSSNVTVKILIQDQNDNPPQVLYPVQTGGSLVDEMVPRSADVGYLVTKVVAVDVDSGQNAWLSYKLQKATDRALFEVGLQNGEIRTIRQVTDKDAVKQRLTVIVEDNGQPSRSATVIVNVAVADSFPEVLSEFTDFTHDKEYNDNLTFYLVLALAVVSFLFITCLVVIISVKIYRWRQSRILYHSNLPVIPYYPPRYSDTLGTGTLPHVYNYEVCRTTDSRKSDCKFGRAGSQNVLIMDPSSTGTMQRIQSEKSILDEPDSPLEISDVNDNAPVFERSSYEAYIVENNTPGLSIFTVKARDDDWNQNARVSYILEDSSVNGVPVSSYVSVSADSGVIHAVRSFDYEQIKDFQFRVKAQDGGSPPLSSNVTVKILIQDQNDNPPQVLYPVQTGGSLVDEMVPRSADVGYLVTKVVAVDVDSGQNAWLSYKLQKATDRALFEVGLQNGEIRTIRQVTDKDAVKQRLTVIVEDNGQPSRSATVIVNVAVADSFPEVLSEFTDFTHDKEYNDNLTFYLVLALAVVSFLFITCLVVIISVKIYRWRQSRILYHSNLPVIPYYPPRYSDTLGTGTLPHVYNYEVCRTTDSRKSDCKFGRAGSQNVLIMDPSSTGTMQRIQSEKSILDEPDSPLEDRNDNPPQVLYPVQTGGSLVDEMVPRSADVGYLVTKVVAVDVDSGQNAWLSYKLQKATDRALFEVGLQNGEIRTIRQVTDKDVVKQRLTVIVEDNGQPSRSATVIVNVAVADSFPEVLSEFTDFTHDKEYNDNLTFYLVLALAVVSFLFITCLVVIISVKIYRWRQSRILYHSNLPVIPYYPPRYSDTLGTGTLPHVYNYEVCRTTDSRKSDCKFGRAGSQNVLIMDPSSTGTMQRIQSEKSILDEPDSPLEDRNDNPPQVLYPVQTGGSLVDEMVPRSADVGYLVTKVVAVDVDSGQNAWLSYKLQKATDRALFEVGLQNGEIRTIRQVTDKDVVKQRLTVIVEDNGQPSRSATVIVNVAVADSFPEVLSEFTDFTHDKEYNDNLTFYLVLALAVVSFLFITCLVVIISVKIYRWRQSRILYHSNLPVIPYYPPRYSDTLGTGTLPHVYNYEVCRTTDSRKSDCKFGRAGSQNVLIMDPSSTGTMQRIQSEKSILDEPDSPLEVRLI
uniref:Protocadherin gamma-A2 n=1 Tax=Larimichthys crocea TaxID=215358 RepID=A0A0F8AYF7_LARCR